mgnify:CR=1 FL=1
MENAKTMHAAVLHAVGDLRYEEVAFPAVAEDEVLVKVKNCGICGSDVGRVLAHGTYHFPTIPGHEFSGEVVFDAENKLTGKRVAVFPLLPCFSCENCKEERYANCTNYNYYGSRCDGGYAEYIAVKRFNLVELPDAVSFEEGAMCEPAAVGLHAIKKLGVKKGDAVLITGAGPIGLIAAQWAKSYGAEKIYFIDNDPTKIEYLKKLGYELYDKQPINCALEGTGASVPLAMVIEALPAGAKAVLMGNPARDIALPAKTYQAILRKELHFEGTWNSSYAADENDWRDAMAAVAEGKIELKPLITHHVALKDALSAIQMMNDRTEFYCKVMIDNER